MQFLIEKFLGRFELKKGCLFIGWFTIAFSAIYFCYSIFSMKRYDCRELLRFDCMLALLFIVFMSAFGIGMAYFYIREIKNVSTIIFVSINQYLTSFIYVQNNYERMTPFIILLVYATISNILDAIFSRGLRQFFSGTTLAIINGYFVLATFSHYKKVREEALASSRLSPSTNQEIYVESPATNIGSPSINIGLPAINIRSPAIIFTPVLRYQSP